jgi:hypothetical protein
MFLPEQLICRSKVGVKLSFYYMWGRGALIFLMPRLFTTALEVVLVVLFYEVGSKQYETAKISRQLRPKEEHFIHNNGILLHKLEIFFSSPHSLATGLGSRALGS